MGLQHIARVHDAITRAGFALAGCTLVVVALSFCYEVVARYFFSAPTEWASPLVSYAMAIMIFLAFPELSRNAAHISINVLTDAVPPRVARRMLVGSRLVAALACLFAAWFCFNETWSQLQFDVWTNPPFAVPKWVISVFIPYGLASSAIHFLRQGMAPDSVLVHGAGSVT
jgi:TRAP-type C4-dicarboxylate transport system permease small subunit